MAQVVTSATLDRTGPAPALDLSVVIVSWNTRDLLLGCLRVLDAALGDLRCGAEVLVVDNASSDGTRQAVRARFPAVRLIELERNAGFAAGNNRGLALARGRTLCLLNPDAEPRPGALAALVGYLDQHPTVGVVGPRLLNPDGSEQAVGFRFPTLAQVFLDLFPLGGRLAGSRLNGRYPSAPRDRAFPIDFPLGACLVARRAAVEAAGPLDERYFMYSEEVDWCRRMRAAGWEVACLPTAEVVHHGGRSTGQQPGAMLVELHRSRLRYYRRYEGAAFVRAAQLLTRLGVLKEALVAWRRLRRGELTRGQWRERVRACGEVFRLYGDHGRSIDAETRQATRGA